MAFAQEWQENIRPELCQKLGVPTMALEPPEAQERSVKQKKSLEITLSLEGFEWFMDSI